MLSKLLFWRRKKIVFENKPIGYITDISEDVQGIIVSGVLTDDKIAHILKGKPNDNP